MRRPHLPRPRWPHLPRPRWPRRPGRGRKTQAGPRNLPPRWNLNPITAAIPVGAVAAIAGVVSYSHIVALGLRTHQGSADSHLLPIPIDGLIVAGSVILAAGSPLGWLGVALGVGGTLFANLQYGIAYGPLSAAVSTWPAVAFTVATFMLERWLKAQAGRAAGSGQDEAAGEAAIADDDSDRKLATDGQCQHGPAQSADEAVVTAFLHGRDCLNEQPSQRFLAARFGVHRTKVAELVGNLNGAHSPDDAEEAHDAIP